jgi:hypothetical protein
MRLGDVIWGSALGCIAVVLRYPVTHQLFIDLTKTAPYAMGFVKVAVLATLGELLALRIVGGRWQRPPGLIYRSIIWGLLGMSFALVFEVFASGVAAAIGKGMLPVGQGAGAGFITAFWSSTVMNLAFAPTMMAFHRLTDTYLDLADGRLDRLSKISLRKVISQIDWQGFVSFVALKTIPFFWIPAHTLTFLLPPEYRVLMAAFLSIALGAILAFAKRKPVLRRIK